MAEERENSIDIAEAVDGAPFSPLLIGISFCLFLTLYFDGLDFGLLGYLIPVIAKDLGSTRMETWVAITVGPIGGALGGLIGGYFGDRHGRRRALFASVALFGSATLAFALANSMTFLIAARFISTIGLGAATPNVAALLAELLPRRVRSQIMGAAFIGFPLGTATNGLLIPLSLPLYGWRGVAVVGAVMPLLLLILLLWAVPESPRYLAARADGRERLAKLLGRLRPDLALTGNESFHLPGQEGRKVSMRALFSRDYRRDTAGLWALGFSNQFASISIASWGATALTTIGFPYLVVVKGLMIGQLSGAAAALFGGWLMGRLGSRWSLGVFSVFGGVVALGLLLFTLAMFDVPVERDLGLILGLTALGVALSGVQLGEYPLSANVYPTTIRASGVGWMVGIARTGAIMAAAITGIIVNTFGAQYIFAGIAAAFVVGWFGLGLIRRHVLPSRAAAAPQM